jgi:AcrR family transcriptional regulator
MPELPVLNLVSAAPDSVAVLPIAGGETQERCDAARNRRRILAAARELVAAEGPSAVTMDRIAAAAGVGKGTLFRRFGDRSGLLRSLLSDREGEFQESLIRGAPPLGPGAPARERLLAFGPAYLTELQDYAELLAAAEKTIGAGRRLAGAPYQFYRTHLALLLRQAAPGIDAEYHADLLLAPLAADVMLHQRDVLGMSVERLAEGWLMQARCLLPA